MTSEEIEMDLWQLYKTGDEEKISRLIEGIARECDEMDVEEALGYAWGDGDEL